MPISRQRLRQMKEVRFHDSSDIKISFLKKNGDRAFLHLCDEISKMYFKKMSVLSQVKNSD